MTSALCQGRQRCEVEAVEALHGRELRGFDPPLNHAPFAVDDFQLNQPQQEADMIDALGRTLACNLVVFAHLRGLAHEPPPASRSR
jgi:hypothetical protein